MPGSKSSPPPVSSTSSGKTPIRGCTDSRASNYIRAANADDSEIPHSTAWVHGTHIGVAESRDGSEKLQEQLADTTKRLAALAGEAQRAAGR